MNNLYNATKEKMQWCWNWCWQKCDFAQKL